MRNRTDRTLPSSTRAHVSRRPDGTSTTTRGPGTTPVSIAHVTKREQFGKKLAELQLVQAAIADMATELCASRLLVASAAYELDADRTVTEAGRRAHHGRVASMAKMHATESAQRIIDRAVQLHGGMGVALGTKVEELYREIRPLRIYEGATDVLKLVIAGSILGK